MVTFDETHPALDEAQVEDGETLVMILNIKGTSGSHHFFLCQ